MAETSTQANNVAVKFKGKAKSLPKHVKRAHKRGLISDKQMVKMLDD